MKILILTLCWSGASLPPNCALFIGKTEEGEASGDSESKHFPNCHKIAADPRLLLRICGLGLVS